MNSVFDSVFGSCDVVRVSTRLSRATRLFGEYVRAKSRVRKCFTPSSKSIELLRHLHLNHGRESNCKQKNISIAE